MKISKIILTDMVQDENGEERIEEIVVEMADATILGVTTDNKVLTQVSTNPAINFDLIRKLLGPIQFEA